MLYALPAMYFIILGIKFTDPFTIFFCSTFGAASTKPVAELKVARPVQPMSSMGPITTVFNPLVFNSTGVCVCMVPM